MAGVFPLENFGGNPVDFSGEMSQTIRCTRFFRPICASEKPENAEHIS